MGEIAGQGQRAHIRYGKGACGSILTDRRSDTARARAHADGAVCCKAEITAATQSEGDGAIAHDESADVVAAYHINRIGSSGVAASGKDSGISGRPSGRAAGAVG